MLKLYEIEPKKLFQSGSINEPADVISLALQGIDAIFDLSGFFDPSIIAILPFTYFHHLILDLPVPPPAYILATFSRAAHSLITGGHKVLTHCTMGKNRSSLLTGIILHLLHPDWTGDAIVMAIKLAVPGSLTNKTFERILLEIGGNNR
jgi:hypothetical protein